jgi:hypothetical protein
MLTHMKFGTYIFFGALTTLGAAFIWLFVPETKNLTLEEMDILFGSHGVAAADNERMREIEREVGLDRLVGHGHHDATPPTYEKPTAIESEKL